MTITKSKFVSDKKKPTSILKINFVGSSHGGEPLTDEEFSDREDEVNNYTIHSVSIGSNKKHHTFYDELDFPVDYEVKKGDTVFIVVVTFEDGDTFGRSYGNVCVVDIFTNEEEAETLASIISDDEKKCDKDDILDRKAKRSYEGYAPWDGYFERLENVEVQKFIVTK
jgi:hypothetical protein